MDIFSMILSLLCGIALFLYGMQLMGDGLKSVAGNKLETLLYSLTNTPLKGILLGTGVTSVIQSSSATSVMVIGFVNSGMMQLAQAIAIVFGANIGTTSEILTPVRKHHTMNAQMIRMPTVSTVGPTMSPMRRARIVDLSRYLFVAA